MGPFTLEYGFSTHRQEKASDNFIKKLHRETAIARCCSSPYRLMVDSLRAHDLRVAFRKHIKYMGKQH